jgi:hypothetical protein
LSHPGDTRVQPIHGLNVECAQLMSVVSAINAAS